MVSDPQEVLNAKCAPETKTPSRKSVSILCGIFTGTVPHLKLPLESYASGTFAGFGRIGGTST